MHQPQSTWESHWRWYIALASWMQWQMQDQGTRHQWGWGSGSSKVTPHVARAPTTMGAPSKDASHIRGPDNTRSPVVLETQSLMARTMTMPLEEAMKCKKCSSSNIARSSSCETNLNLVLQSHLINAYIWNLEIWKR